MFTNMPKIDVICPMYHVDWNFLTSNITSWFNELDVNRLIISFSNPDQAIFDNVYRYLIQRFTDGEVHLFDHRHHKTLGKCLVELMDHVETDWFAYVHSDVELTPFCFNIMQNLMNGKTGIIESERLHYDGVKYTYDPYYFSARAYSGFQIIRKEAIQKGIDIIEDDYLYRNEDMIFQNICEQAGFEYVKTLAMHIHQLTTTKKWTFERFDTYDMQWRGLVKYTTPTDVTVQACLDALRVCVNEFGADMNDTVDSMPSNWQLALITKLLQT